MSQERLPPPDPAPCLGRAYPSSQKGGTRIAEEVTDRAEHQRRLCDPDGYRPANCPKCGHAVLHVHDYRERTLRAEPGAPGIRIVRHQCAACEGIWQTLPAFVARHLWRSWTTVQASTLATSPSPSSSPSPSPLPPPGPVVPRSTIARWWSRLLSPAGVLMQVLASSGSPALDAIVFAVGLEATRHELVAAYASRAGASPPIRLLDLPAFVHRLVPGIRLM
jgi:Domain of unknown function (DUF6431)